MSTIKRGYGRKDKLKNIAFSNATMSQFAKGRPDKHGGKRPYVAGDEKTFDEAFKFIRGKYGKDATFIWRGKEFNTKRKDD